MLAPNELKPIGPWVKGDVVAYITRRPVKEKRWYLGFCIGKSDKHTDDVLKNSDVECWCPMIREFRKLSRKQMSQKQRESGIEIMRPKLVPLLPRYRIMLLDPHRKDMDEVFGMAGIGGLVCREGSIIQVPESFIAQVTKLEQDGAIPGKTSTRVVFAIGEKVRVTDGPLVGFAGVVEKGLDVAIEDLDPEMRIKVAVSCFSRATPVDLEVTQVQKL